MELIFSSILRGFLELNPASGLDIFADPIVKGSVEIYSKVTADFLPTPTKSHYTFNLRDLSKVVQGILQIKHEHLNDKDMLVQLWLHETFRVFRDRLVDVKDRDKFNDITFSVMKKQLDVEWEKADYADVRFGDYDNGERDYMKLPPTKNLLTRLDDYLEAFNSENTGKMNLVFFDDAISHMTRTARIVRSQRGNALLVGVGGSGRRSMARLASFISNMSCYSIEITKNYREKEWHENIKDLLREVGVEDKPKTFLFADTQIVYESFLEDINNILNTGEVPNLFAADE